MECTKIHLSKLSIYTVGMCYRPVVAIQFDYMCEEDFWCIWCLFCCGQWFKCMSLWCNPVRTYWTGNSYCLTCHWQSSRWISFPKTSCAAAPVWSYRISIKCDERADKIWYFSQMNVLFLNCVVCKSVYIVCVSVWQQSKGFLYLLGNTSLCDADSDTIYPC